MPAGLVDSGVSYKMCIERLHRVMTVVETYRFSWSSSVLSSFLLLLSRVDLLGLMIIKLSQAKTSQV